MPLSSDVRLARVYRPKFPHRCVHCDRLGPDASVRIYHNSQNPLVLILLPVLYAFGWSHVDAPICKTCKPKFQMQRVLRTVALMALIFAALVLFGPLLAGWSSWARRLLGIGMLLIATIPVALYEVLRPRRFATSTIGDSIDYQFASPAYAAEFKAMNESRSVRRED
jgi:hypothetical protein